jgi:L-2-hydroxyglutarate oxidase LhgO
LWQPPTQYFCRGTYFRIQQDHHQHDATTTPPPPSLQHLIYPVPDPSGGLGVHATMDLAGRIKFGPDVEWLDVTVTNPDSIDMQPDASRAAMFYPSIRTYWPTLSDDTLVPDYTGIRPKLGHPSLYRHDGGVGTSSMPFHDFVIAGPESHGVPGLVHLFGMESPGLTSSMAIADYVAKLVGT